MAISAHHDLPHWLFLKMPVLRFVGQWGTLLQIFSPAGGSSREVHGAIGTGFVVGAVLLRKFRFFRVVLSVSVLKNKQQRGGGQNLPGVNYIYLTARAQKKTQVKTTPPLNSILASHFCVEERAPRRNGSQLQSGKGKQSGGRLRASEEL